MIGAMGARALFLLALVGCGGGTGKGPRNDAPAGFADVATTRALLERYSPGGYAVVTAYEALPTTFQLPEGAYRFGEPHTFAQWLDDGALEMLPTRMSTAVHELAHGYAARMAFQLMADRGEELDGGGQAILADGEPWLVRFTPHFPSRELDPTFPSDARTTRYGAYIAGEHSEGSTQIYGVHGLLDEYAAYYLGNRTTLDMWPWVRDVAPTSTRLIMQYGVELDDLERAYTEITLYILHYLKHAREHRPDVYQALLASDDFRGAFGAVHAAFTALVDRARALEPEVWALARTRGVDLTREDGRFVIDGHPQRADDGIVGARAHLASQTYQAELAALRYDGGR
jgi:hypothetical protein